MLNDYFSIFIWTIFTGFFSFSDEVKGWFLLCGDSCTTIPCEIYTIILDTMWLFSYLAINEPSPSIFLTMFDRFLLRIELDFHVWEWITTKNVVFLCDFHEIWWKIITYVDVHPINGFSQRSRLSNSISQWCKLSVPLCMEFFAGT